MSEDITLHHNLAPRRFVWLWMKYVTGVNDAHHCTNVLRGRYSKKLSKHRAGAGEQGLGASIVCDEQPAGSFAALYVCGVAAQGYRQLTNYPHNPHLPILPGPGPDLGVRLRGLALHDRKRPRAPDPLRGRAARPLSLAPARVHDLPDLPVGRNVPFPGRSGIRVVVTLAVTCPSLAVPAFGSS